MLTARLRKLGGFVLMAATVSALATALPGRAHDPPPSDSQAGPAGDAEGHTHGEGATQDHDHGEGAHVHAPVPPEYRSAHVPSFVWTDARMIARGKEIYASRCAVCHGDEGDGKGPAGTVLPLKPPDLRDGGMMSEMAGNYWFWRVSEGGLVEPFRGLGSAMPAWKDELSVEDRWAVIAYQHTFSGHRGPHVTSEHPTLAAPVAASTSGSAPGSPAPQPAPGAGSSHKH